MNGSFRAQATDLRNGAANPDTDLRLVRLMIETAEDLEAAADAKDMSRARRSLMRTAALEVEPT